MHIEFINMLKLLAGLAPLVAVSAARPPQLEANQLGDFFPGGLTNFIHSLPQDEQDVFFRVTADSPKEQRTRPSRVIEYRFKTPWGFGRPAASRPRPHEPERSSMASSSPASTRPPRLVLYQQTHHEKSGEAVSLLPLLTNKTGVTHVYIAALHVHPPDAEHPIHLNDHAPQDSRFDQMWSEVKQLQDAGIVVMGMLGGAAPGTYVRLSASEDIVPNSRSKTILERTRLTSRSSKSITLNWPK
jgi:hypothetical protein